MTRIPPIIRIKTVDEPFVKRAVVFFALLFALNRVQAQETLTVMQTGGGLPLQTETRPVTVDSSLLEPALRFQFGFATDESVGPGLFYDSFTISVQDESGLFTALYLTSDAGGTVFAPVTPGTLFIEPTSITAAALAYPDLESAPAHRSAFEVSALLPPQLSGGTVHVYFDLFDNLDGAASQAWFGNVTVVPEPATGIFLLVAGIFAWSVRKFRR
jgi:hypothetical protein